MYLGLIISYNRIKMDSKKVTVIINWESPINVYVMDLKILVVLITRQLRQDLNKLVDGMKLVEL
jgi:hypothetical protein